MHYFTIYNVQIERSIKPTAKQSIANPYSFHLACPVTFTGLQFCKADATARKLAIQWQRKSRKYNYRAMIVESEWDESEQVYRVVKLHPYYGASLCLVADVDQK